MMKVVAYLFLELVFGYGFWFFLNPFVSDSVLVIVLFIYGLFTIAPILGKMMMLPTKTSDFTTWCVVNLLILVMAMSVIAFNATAIFPPFFVLSIMVYVMRVIFLNNLVS